MSYYTFSHITPYFMVDFDLSFLSSSSLFDMRIRKL